MKTTKRLFIGLTLAAFALSGAAQARGDGDRTGMQRDGARAEQRSEGHRGQTQGPRKDLRSNRASGDRRADHRVGPREQRHARQSAHRQATAHWVDNRQHRQSHRIRAGLRSGDITRGEARQLKRQQARITKMERRYTADGHLSHRERARLERAQDRAGRKIRHARHNDLYRGHDRYASAYGWGHIRH